jgi:hypothetical protein
MWPFIDMRALIDQNAAVVTGKSEVDRLIAALVADGVAGVEDFGRFISNPTYFRPSAFDELAAMPTLLRLLPTLTDRDLVGTVAAHLRRPWARPSAFPELLRAFNRFAPGADGIGWAIGDALASAADYQRVPELIEVCSERSFGTSRQMVVDAMWRFKKNPEVAPLLESLLRDATVAGHAAGALRRTIGEQAALPLMIAARNEAEDRSAQRGLDRNIRKASRRRI